MIVVTHKGKLKHPFYKYALEEYKERINRYIKFQLLSGNKGNLLKKSTNILSIALNNNGKLISTEEFKQIIENATLHSKDLNFIIGDPFGIPNEIITKCDLTISFGRQTMQHELTICVLLEQIYRAFTIIRGEPYHK